MSLASYCDPRPSVTGMEDDAGIWFSDSKLLRSEVAAGWAADAAADAEAVTELLEELC